MSPAPADYVGPSPLYAPESRAMYDFTLALDPALTLSYHTQGNVIYWRFQDYEPKNAKKLLRPSPPFPAMPWRKHPMPQPLRGTRTGLSSSMTGRGIQLNAAGEKIRCRFQISTEFMPITWAFSPWAPL